MATIAIPATMPPAIEPAWLLECEVGDGDAVGDALAPDVDTPDGPKIAPGPYSGKAVIYETSVGDNERKNNMRKTMLTTKSIRFIAVPIVFVLKCVVIMVLFFIFQKKLETNRDIDNSPVRNTYSRRDRVREPRN